MTLPRNIDIMRFGPCSVCGNFQKPCQCQLRKRIADLEAELAKVRSVAEDAIAALDYYGKHFPALSTWPCPVCEKTKELKERLK